MKKFYFPLLFISFVSIFSIHYFVSGQAVYGDGIGYYAYLHSWYFDADNDFTNEYRHIYNHENNNSQRPLSSPIVQIVGTNSQGKALNHFSPGTALLLLPFYALADGVVVVANFFGASLARTGYSDTYQMLSGVGAILYVVAVAWLSEKLLLMLRFKQSVGRVAVLLLLLSTNLLYYGSFDVLNSHFASFFLATLFFFYFYKQKQRLSTKNYFVLGLIAGLLSITRPQDAVISVVVLVAVAVLFKKNKSHWQQILKNLFVFFGIQFLMFLPLVLQWITTFDTFDSHPYFLWMTAQQSQSSMRDLAGTLFHFTNGLFTRTPILFVSAALFVRLAYKKKLDYFLKVLFIFFCFQYAIIVLQGGWKAAAYGGRMFISSLPLFLILLAKILEWIEGRYSKIILWIFVGVFVSINVLSISSFVLFEKEASGNKFGTELYTGQRIMKLLDR
ncbi:MAG: hypothetical protein GW947_02160 [Candidatus Pacebacteria bacterium]|nr:hypothetical protein [Candidatus Paceibacterota bacterium]